MDKKKQMKIKARAMGSPGQLLGFSQIPDRPYFIWWVKAFPGYSVNTLTMSSQKKYVSLNIKFQFCN